MPQTEDSLGFLINDVARLLRRNFNRRAQSLGLSQAQWRTLAMLSRSEGVNQVTLAEALEIKPITLARLLDQLQDAGLVERRPDPGDRRAFRLYLTPQAQPLLADLMVLGAQTRKEALESLSPPARVALVEGLAAMKENLLGAETAASPGEARKAKTVGR